MRLLLARHGATTNNAAGRFTGQTDIPMSALGERQTAALAARLAHHHIDAVVSSDLRRASDMAQRITERHGLDVRLDVNLREISMGSWEGATITEIREREPELLRRWEDDPLGVAPSGGETVLQVRDRLVQALNRWYAAYPDGTVLWVTHGGCIGILVCHLLGVDLRRRWQFRKDNAALSEMELGSWPHSLDGDAESGDDNGDAPSLSAVVVARLNDTSHLDGIVEAGAVERFQVL